MLIDRLLFADKTPLILKKALDSQSERHLLISSNISNIDTPGYQAKDIDFKGALKAALGTDDGLALRTTHRSHIGPNRDDISALRTEPFNEPDAAKSNGNNVNIDKEMMKLAENQISYNATIQMMAKRTSTLRAAITENAQG
ncbi:MAG: flagellar basal body rod protein FlgB [Nitrospinota bacterium]|nr:flagellar basal body rod protein FlgB [Nitrospinota bacterium]